LVEKASGHHQRCRLRELVADVAKGCADDHGAPRHLAHETARHDRQEVDAEVDLEGDGYSCAVPASAASTSAAVGATLQTASSAFAHVASRRGLALDVLGKGFSVCADLRRQSAVELRSALEPHVVQQLGLQFVVLFPVRVHCRGLFSGISLGLLLLAQFVVFLILILILCLFLFLQVSRRTGGRLWRGNALFNPGRELRNDAGASVCLLAGLAEGLLPRLSRVL